MLASVADLVPAEVGPQLRLAYTDQPLNEWMVVTMEPIADPDGDLGVFDVGRRARGGAGRWFRTYCGDPDVVRVPAYRWVFVRRNGISPRTLGSLKPV